MDVFSPDEEKGLTSAFHSKRNRGYGAAVSDLSGPCKTPKLTITHLVSESDTLQSLAVKYDSQVADIKRVNGLWNNESLVLRDTVKIPVYNDVNVSVDSNGHAEFPSTSSGSTRSGERALNIPSRKPPAANSVAKANDSYDSDNFFAKFDTSLDSLKKKVAQQVESASSYLEEEDDLLYTSAIARLNHGSDASSITSTSSKGKGRASTGSLNSLSKISSNEDIRSTPDHTVIKAKHKKKLHKYEQAQDEELFQL